MNKKSFKVTDKNGNVITNGMEIPDFRGDKWIFSYASRAPEPGRTGKVVVQDMTHGGSREFYMSVFDLTVEEVPA